MTRSQKCRSFIEGGGGVGLVGVESETEGCHLNILPCERRLFFLCFFVFGFLASLTDQTS